MNMARRLAAIVAVDVVGYSRLMATDEDDTWSALNELRRLIDPVFETGGGRIVKSTGDGVLVESPSVIEAVKSAIRVQEVTAEWNQRRPADRALRLRIGVNLGDVIIADDGDVYGDGVNVAARLEGLADPGGVCLSDSAYQQVRGRIEARFVDRGEQWVKNIPVPVRVWAVLSGGDAETDVDIGVSGLDHAEVVGRGGNATVYRAYQQAMDRWVGVKVLDGSDEATRRRFDRERQAMGRLSQHPGIVTIYESGYTPTGRPYLVMPFLGNGSLQDRLDRAGPMPWTEAADIIAHVAKAVDHAHRMEIVHRDLKPANIMLDDEGRPLVADFGIARLTNQSSTITDRTALTPSYSPPELLDGAEPSAAADTYGLAATFCALVSGTPPFTTGTPDTDTLLALSRRIVADPPPDLRPLGVPEYASVAVEAAMAKEPEQRPASAQQFADALAGTVSPSSVTPSPNGDAPSRRRIDWKKVGPLGAGAVAVLVLGVVTALGALNSEDPDAPTTTLTTITTTSVSPATSDTTEQTAGAEWSVTFDVPILSVAIDEAVECVTATSCAAAVVVALLDGTIDGIDVRSGQSRWAAPFDAGAPSQGGSSGGLPLATSLVVADERVYFVRTGSKLIYAIDTADGTQAWPRTLAPFDSAEGSPLVAETDGMAVVAFGLGVAALDPSASEEWTVPGAARQIIALLSADGRLIAVADPRSVYGLAASDGTGLWEVGPPDIGAPRWLLAQEVEIVSGTGRSFDRRVFVHTGDGDLVALDGDDGSIRWRVAISHRPGSAPDDVIYVGGVDQELLAIDAATGEVIWTNGEDVTVDGPPVVTGDTVYVLSGSEIVAVRARSGSERGRIDLPGSPSTPIHAVGDLVITAIGDTLFAFQITG